MKYSFNCSMHRRWICIRIYFSRLSLKVKVCISQLSLSISNCQKLLLSRWPLNS